MRIFVDADACPVVGIIETIAEKYNIPTTLLCDTNHILYSDYSEVIVVGAGAAPMIPSTSRPFSHSTIASMIKSIHQLLFWKKGQRVTLS